MNPYPPKTNSLPPENKRKNHFPIIILQGRALDLGFAKSTHFRPNLSCNDAAATYYTHTTHHAVICDESDGLGEAPIPIPSIGLVYLPTWMVDRLW